MKRNLIFTLFVTQVALWISYFLFFMQKNIDFKLLWGNTPSQLFTPLLAIAGAAYVMNLWLINSMAFSDNVTDTEEWTLISCILLYYVAQLLFLPLTYLAVNKRISKSVVTMLLLACVIPFAIIAGVVTKHASKPDTKHVVLKLIAAFFPLLHVLIDDAILYGFLF